MACGGRATTTHAIQPVVSTLRNGFHSWHGLPEPAVTDTSLGFIFSWVTSPLGQAPIREELARVDPATGQVKAEREVNGSVLDVVASDGFLFVTTRTSSGEDLLRLAQRTLAESRSWQVLKSDTYFGQGTMALAGGGLWVASGDRLDRFSLPHVVMTKTIELLGAASSDVTTDSTGSVLVVTKADEGGTGMLERRDPVTGALLRTSSSISGLVDPHVNGIIGNDIWVSEATGMMGYTELYDLDDLTAVGAPCNEGASNPTCLVGTNSIAAQLTRDLLWVTQTAGGPARNFCGQPDGRVEARLSVPDNDSVLGIGTQNDVIFVLNPQLSMDKGQTVTEEPIPKECS